VYIFTILIEENLIIFKKINYIIKGPKNLETVVKEYLFLKNIHDFKLKVNDKVKF